MGDLAVALIDLARNAERRRDARRNLRDSVATVITEMLRHLRVGDRVVVTTQEEDGFERRAAYVVERVTWNIEEGLYSADDYSFVEWQRHPTGAATLVRYWPEGPSDGAVLLDVRAPHTNEDGKKIAVKGRAIYAVPRPDRQGRLITQDLRLATDQELVLFSEEVPLVIAAFAERVKADAADISEAAATIARLSPR